MENSRTYDIVGGPNREMIIDAFKYNRDKIIIPIEFDVVAGYSAPPTTDGCMEFLLDVERMFIREIGQAEKTGDDLRLSGELYARISPAEEYLPYSFFIERYNHETHRGEICLTRKSAIVRNSSR